MSDKKLFGILAGKLSFTADLLASQSDSCNLNQSLDEMMKNIHVIKNFSQTNLELWNDFLDYASSVCVLHISNPRHGRKIVKLSAEVICLDKQGFLGKMVNHLKNLFSEESDIKIYQTILYLLDIKDIRETCLEMFFETLIKKLEYSFICKQNQEINDPIIKEFQLMLRLSMQIFHFPSIILRNLETCNENIQTILLSLLKISTSNHLKEISSLAATAYFTISYCIKDINFIFKELFLFINKSESYESSSRLSLLSPSLIYGLLHCGKLDLLKFKFFTLHNTVIEDLLPNILQLCKNDEDRYQMLLLLLNWLKAIKIILVDISLNHKLYFQDENSPIVADILEIIWNNWESPLDGVSGLVTEIFSNLLQVHEYERTKWTEGDNKFINYLFTQLMHMPWYIKGKYGLLVCLIPYCNVTESSCCFQLCTSLYDCLSVNQLAARSSEIYAICLKKIRKDCTLEKSTELWKLYWMIPLLKALMGKPSLNKRNACQYWVPCTLKIFPESLMIMLEELETNSAYCHHTMATYAQIILLKYARHINMMNFSDMVGKENLFREAFKSVDDDLRADVFSLICQTHKKAEPLCKLEFELLKKYLPYNLNINSPSFTHSLVTSLGHSLIRIRDSTIAIHKKSKTGLTNIPENIQEAVDFIEWLYNLIIISLFPGASYQRMRSCLDIYGTLLNTFTVVQSTYKKKGCVPDSTSFLVDFIQSKGLWQWHSSRVARIMLHCVLNTYQDIQKLSISYLSKFPSTSSGWLWLNQLEIANNILKQAFVLLNSAKTSECESGAYLLNFCFKKFIIDQKWQVKESDGLLLFSGEIYTKEDHWKKLFYFLISKIKSQYELSQKDLLMAATHNPIHGLFYGIHQCIFHNICYLCTKDGKEIISIFIEKLTFLAQDIINSMLEALGKNAGTQDTAPSFAEMGKAIDYLIQASDIANLSEENSALSADHQLILACCWLNIKETVSFLADMASIIVKHNFLNPDILLIFNQTFVKVLTQCRHKGAIEACSSAFGKFCHVLLNNGCEKLKNISKDTLLEALSLITTTAFSSSVTRRSAGVPMLIQNILVNEPIYNQNFLLNLAVSKLIEITEQSIPENHNEKCDLPQCHALHTLKVLFRDAALTKQMLPYISVMMKLTIDGFESPAWAVRNATTQLFGCLIIRMVGDKRIPDEDVHCNSITARDFFVTYPDLQPYFISILENYYKTNHVSPKLFPVLVLLSKLGHHDQELDSSASHNELIDSYITFIKKLSSCPVYAVRSVAASAVLPFIPQTCFWSEVNVLLQSLLKCNSHSNQLQGNILFIQVFLKNITVNPPDHLHGSLFQSIENSLLLASSLNPCYLIRGQLLQVIIQLLQYFNDRIHCLKIIDSISDALKDSADATNKIGFSVFCQSACHLFLMINPNDWVIPLINSGVQSIVEATLEYLVDHLHEMNLKENAQQEILDTILFLLPETDYLTSLQLMLHVIISLNNVRSNIHFPFNFLNTFRNLIQSSKGLTVSSLSIHVLGIAILDNMEDCAYFSEFLSLWSEKVWLNSQYLQPETTRFYACHALKDVAAQVLQRVGVLKDSSLALCCLRIFEAAVTLLQDEEMTIRKEATAIFSSFEKLTGSSWKKHDFHASVALEGLFTYMSKVFYWFSDFHCWLLGKLQNQPSSLHLLQSLETSSSALFEQADINIYQEPILIAELCFKTLQLLIYTEDHFETILTPQAVMKHLQMIQECILFINNQNYDVFGEMTCRDRAFTILYTDILWLKFTFEYGSSKQMPWVDDVLEVMTEIKEIVRLFIPVAILEK